MRTCARHLVGIFGAMAMCPGPVAFVRAQDAQSLPAFEVASVKPSEPGTSPYMGGRGGRLTASGVSPFFLLTAAYQVPESRIVGLPAWAQSERFDVQAKAPAGVPIVAPQPGRPGTIDLMTRSLLMERFALKAHTETREMPVYVLQKAREDGKPGSAITPSTVDCAALRRAQSAAGTLSPDVQRRCGTSGGMGQLRMGGRTIAFLASMVETQVGRVVIDRTGMSGTFDIELTWTPERFARLAEKGLPLPEINGKPADINGPSIFAALQEQLGLRLESTRAPVEVLVIDSISRPTPD